MSKLQTRCQYCGGGQEHSPHCPATIDSPRALKEWEMGYSAGFNHDEEKPGYYWSSLMFPKTWDLGCNIGRTEINLLADEAFQSEYSFEDGCW